MVYSQSKQFSTNQVKLKNKTYLNELDKRCNISDDVQKTQLKLIYSEISSMVLFKIHNIYKKNYSSYPPIDSRYLGFVRQLGIRLLHFKDSYNKFMEKMVIKLVK